jgi:hypothetical protein
MPFLKYVDVLLDFVILCVFENGRDLNLVKNLLGLNLRNTLL